jgi:SAM-dependent methyltransferase
MNHLPDDRQMAALGSDPEFCQRLLANSPVLQQFLNMHITAQLRGQLDELSVAPCGQIDVELRPSELEGLFRLVAAQWEKVGSEKPHWSVLSSDEFLPSALTPERLREFYASGENEVRLLQDLCTRNGLVLPGGGRCLEFGCGVGRVTIHLARRFAAVEGVDISAPNLAECRKIQQEQGLGNMLLRHLREPSELSAIEPFDVLFSRIVLQHNPPPVQRFLLKSLLERLRTGGVALFQTVVHGRGYAYNATSHLQNAQTQVFEMHALPMRYIFECLNECGCRCVEVIRDTSGGFNVGSYTFLVRKL